jgi:hypothetical protein
MNSAHRVLSHTTQVFFWPFSSSCAPHLVPLDLAPDPTYLSEEPQATEAAPRLGTTIRRLNLFLFIIPLFIIIIIIEL